MKVSLKNTAFHVMRILQIIMGFLLGYASFYKFFSLNEFDVYSLIMFFGGVYIILISIFDFKHLGEVDTK